MQDALGSPQSVLRPGRHLRDRPGHRAPPGRRPGPSGWCWPCATRRGQGGGRGARAARRRRSRWWPSTRSTPPRTVAVLDALFDARRPRPGAARLRHPRRPGRLRRRSRAGGRWPPRSTTWAPSRPGWSWPTGSAARATARWWCCRRWPASGPARTNYVYGSTKAGLDAFAQGLGDALVERRGPGAGGAARASSTPG